jgi:hypothetical protein
MAKGKVSRCARSGGSVVDTASWAGGEGTLTADAGGTVLLPVACQATMTVSYVFIVRDSRLIYCHVITSSAT